MNKTQLARDLGISRRMVYKLIDKGMPISSLLAAQDWRQKNINPFMGKSYRVDGNTGTPAFQINLKVRDASQLYANARAVKERTLALKATAEYEKLMESLVSKVEVEKLLFETAIQFSDGLAACARRLSPEIANKADIAEVESILTREFTLLLESIGTSLGRNRKITR